MSTTTKQFLNGLTIRLLECMSYVIDTLMKEKDIQTASSQEVQNAVQIILQGDLIQEAVSRGISSVMRPTM
jgi:hypothetical protein